MLTQPIFLMISLSIALFSSTVEIFFSQDELNDMGIRLDHQDSQT